MASGTGINRPVHNPFDRIEMDAHKLDGRFVVMIPQLDGGWSPRLIHRLWVIVLLDVASRAVIGYHLSLRLEVNKEDVIAAISKVYPSAGAFATASAPIFPPAPPLFSITTC